VENFTAVSELTWQGLPPNNAPGQQPEERTFLTLFLAREWLKEKKCGGVIRHFDGVDVRVVERVPPG
jgi:hypothetical protein